MRGSKSRDLDAEYCCKIRLLDDSELSCDFKKDAKGEDVFAFVCKEMDLIEKDYFGLRYVDENKQRHWLQLDRELSKQLKNTKQPYMFFFRVRFYPTNPTKLQEEITRYQLFLQLKRDILHGRLICPFNEITELAALVVQAEAGDYNEEEHQGNYIGNIKLLPRQTEKLEDKIAEIHKSLRGQTPAEAEERFLDQSQGMDLYGVDPHPCRDQDDAQLYLGLTPHGIQVIRDAKRVSGFEWSEINKVTYESRAFYIQVIKDKTNYSFKLNDTSACKHLWKCTVEQMGFYSGDKTKSHYKKRSTLSPQNLFRRKKYRYSGKTESQINVESEKINRRQPSFCRTPSIRMVSSRKASTQPSRHSFAMDDRASQNFSTADHNNRTSVVYTSEGEDANSEVNDSNVDHLKKFETSDFPPDPPLDTSRTSLVVTDDDASEGDRTQSELEPAGQSDLRVHEEKPAGESEQSFISKNLILPIIFGLLVLFLGVILEMKFNLLKIK